MGNFTPDKMKLKDLLAGIDSGRIKLPCFQRNYVWTSPRVKKLLDSIQCDHPAGTLLFLAVDYNNPIIPDMPFNFTNKEKQSEQNLEYLVLDGQQRLTSCYTAFYNLGNKTYFLNYKQLMELDESNKPNEIEFEELIIDKKHLDYPEQKLDEGLIPLSFMKDPKTMRESLKQYKDSIKLNSAKEKIYDFLDTKLGDYLDSVFEYEFPVVILPKSLKLDAVCKVFQTINSTGLKLTAFDICVAKFMRQGINLKDKVEEAKKQNNIAKMVLENEETIILQTIALLSNIAPKKNALADNLTSGNIQSYWDKAIDGIKDAMTLLDDFGAGTKKSLSILPYKPIIPLFAAILISKNYSKLDIKTRSNMSQKLKKFFYCSALVSRYTEGTDNKLKDDFNSIQTWLTGDIPPSIITNGIMWNTQKYLSITKQSAFGKAILCLINSQHPKDFYEDKNVGFGENTSSTQIHHIFPEAEYKEEHQQLINSVFNFTFLTNEANNFISDKKTKKYIDEILKTRNITQEELKTIMANHLIDSKCFDAIYKGDLKALLKSRAELVKNKFQNIV